MSKGPKYFSIDIETTGLDTARSLVLQLATVYDDGESPIDQLKTFNETIYYPVIGYGEPYALQMNAAIIKRSMETRLLREQCAIKWGRFLNEINFNGDKVTAAGKNFAGFDAPILRSNGFSLNRFKHRVIDPGTLWLPDFGYVPSLDEINKRLGREAVTHDALEDCFDVVAAIRAKTWKETE